jgi:hypothetical protein
MNSDTIKKFWDNYRNNFWNSIYLKINENDDNFINSIMFWGVIPYLVYKNSIFYYTCPIITSLEKNHIFFISRMTTENKIRHYFFINSFAFKNHIINGISFENLEENLLKKLYLSDISLSSVFIHKYMKNCWESILMMEENG